MPGEESVGREIPDVFHLDRLMVDTARGRRYPARERARLRRGLHQRGDEFAVFLRRQPFTLVIAPFRLGHDAAGRADKQPAELPDRAMEAAMRQAQAKIDAGILDNLVPSR